MKKATLPPGAAKDAARIEKLIQTLAKREGWQVNTFCARRLNDANFVKRMMAGRVTPRTMLAAERMLQPLL